MKFENDGPVTLYVVIFVPYGDVRYTCTNRKAARDWRASRVSVEQYKILAYDQRGTRGVPRTGALYGW